MRILLDSKLIIHSGRDMHHRLLILQFTAKYHQLHRQVSRFISWYKKEVTEVVLLIIVMIQTFIRHTMSTLKAESELVGRSVRWVLRRHLKVSIIDESLISRDKLFPWSRPFLFDGSHIHIRSAQLWTIICPFSPSLTLWLLLEITAYTFQLLINWTINTRSSADADKPAWHV